MPSPSILQELLGDIPAASFLDQQYLKLPFARNAGLNSWSRLADWSAVERLLRHPDADVIVGREGERWPGGASQPEQMREILAEGYTIGLRHVDRYDAGLRNLADRFHEAFAAPIDVHLYCTPANQAGFGWHYDAEEVFVLQTHGGKEWWLRKNTVNPWPLIDAIPADQRYDRELMPALHCRLEAGDWLYIPGGYWHKTQAVAESISLSVGVRAWTALDVYDLLRSALADSMLWRQRLPCLATGSSPSDEELLGRLKEMLEPLGEDLSRRFRDDVFLHNLVERFRQSSAGASNSDREEPHFS
jgi:ribosomal protein L16 Arg81 hydroxylase